MTVNEVKNWCQGNFALFWCFLYFPAVTKLIFCKFPGGEAVTEETLVKFNLVSAPLRKSSYFQRLLFAKEKLTQHLFREYPKHYKEVLKYMWANSLIETAIIKEKWALSDNLLLHFLPFRRSDNRRRGFHYHHQIPAALVCNNSNLSWLDFCQRIYCIIIRESHHIIQSYRFKILLCLFAMFCNTPKNEALLIGGALITRELS